jgi:fumarate reductase flavoprotein subunit
VGKQAAEDALEARPPVESSLSRLAQAEQDRLVSAYLAKEGGRERVAAVRRDMQRAMEAGAGIYRTEESLKEATEEMSRLKDRYRDVALDDRSRAFNTEVVAALELENMLDVAETVVRSGLERRESRGSHTRRDHPERNDERFAKHSLALATPEGARIEYRDVTITRWPLAERTY